MSFINTIFLFATAAAVLPVVIHLVRRMKARTVPFSSLMFLKATPKELIRKRRLRDKLLMAARAALLALLALVFARPFIPADKIPLVPTRESESVVLLIDRSFSMQYGGAFERALEKAGDRMGSASGSDEFAVIAFDEEVQLLAGLDSDPVVRQASLDGLSPGYRATDFFPALQRAEDVLQDAQNDRRVVVLISDFQDAGWTGSLDNWKLQEGFTFETVAVRGEGSGNAYVEAFELSRKTSGGEGLVRFDAHISAGGLTNRRDRQVTLTVGGIDTERQTLPPARASVSFQQRLSREGYYQGSLSLEGDDLPADDRFYFTDHFGGMPEILIVDEPSPGSRSAGFFVRNAFDLGEASRFRVAATQQLTASRLRGSDVVFLTIGGGRNEAERRALHTYVEEGGTLILSSGAESDPTSMSATLESLDVGRVERVVDARSELGYEVIIGEVDPRHPVFEPFASARSGAILRPRIRRYARFVPGEATRVIGRFDSGDPFLAERDVGRGRVLFFTSTFNTSWTDMPLDEMFVPFLYELVEYGTRRTDVRRNVTVGEPISLAGAAGESVEVRTPDGRLYRVELDEDGHGFFRQTDVPGNYTSDGEPSFFSVNVDRRESNLAAREADEIYAAVMPPPQDAPITPAQAAAVIEDEEKDQKLWRTLLLIVIALFGIETFMANRRSGTKAGTSLSFKGE